MCERWIPLDFCQVYYASVDIQSMFIDAVARGDPPESEIVRYVADERAGVCAYIRNKETRTVDLYRMDIGTKRPAMISGPENDPPPRPRKRARLSRSYKEWRAAYDWQER